MPQPSTEKSAPLKDAVGRLWQEALQSVEAQARERSADHVRPSREWFVQLPTLNRRLLGGGVLCIGLGLFCLVGVPLLSYGSYSLRGAILPYTGEGKRQSCLSNLQRVSTALAQYRDDYDGKFPAEEYVSGGRKTWVALLRARNVDSASFTCPSAGRGHSDGQVTSSYGFNPVLLGQPVPQGDDPGHVLLLADRADAHDTILFPPFAGWPAAKKAGDGASLDKANNLQGANNLDFRHSGNQTAVLYADGHAESSGTGDWTGQALTWGGAAVFTTGLYRLEAKYPLLQNIAAAPPQAFKSQKDKLRQALGELHLLEKQSIANAMNNETVEKRLWQGAGVLHSLGDSVFERQLDSDLNQYARSLLTGVRDLKPAASENGENLSFTLRYPQSWKIETETDGRYRTTHFRSPSPYLEAVVERGERVRPTNATTIDWTGMEDGLKKKYGSGYRRLRMGGSTLGGQDVSVWECELKKPEGPKLRKRYLGHSSTWNSTILVVTAPSGEWQDWSPVFAQIINSFELRE